MPEKGILYVAFGLPYINLVKAVIEYSRKCTSLPICVLSNQEIDGEWCKTNNVINTVINDVDNSNRNYKTLQIQYTPFQTTLYLDADSVIVKPGIEAEFDFDLDTIVLNRYFSWREHSRLFRIYRNHMRTVGVTLPITVYNGAYVCYHNTPLMHSFFNKWNENWKANGSGRDMPSLACAVKQLDLKVKKTLIFCPEGKRDKTVMHGRRYLKNVCGITYRYNKPFDGKRRGEWSNIFFDGT